MQVLAVSGPSGQGKTLLLEALLAAWHRPVPVLKLSHHPLAAVCPERPGADSARLAAAGAAAVALLLPDGLFLRGPADPERVLDALEALYGDGWLLLEGGREAPWPQVRLEPEAARVRTADAVIGPQPGPARHWLPSALPLTPAAAGRAARWVEARLSELAFCWPPPPDAGWKG